MKKDANDILREEGTDSLRAWCDGAEEFNDASGTREPPPGEQRRPPLKLVLARDIKLEPKLHLIDGFLGQHEQSGWFGPPDSGKSTVLVDVGCHIAARITYCGRAVQGGAVLYVACERGAVVKRRVKAWCIEHDLPDIPLAVIDDAIDLRTDKIDADRIIAATKQLAEITDMSVVLIIIDTLNRALTGGDENSSKDMGALLGAVDRVYRATLAHLALVHHTPADRTDRMRGHGSVTAAFDMTVAIRRADGAVLVTVEKGNDLVERPELKFEFKSVPLPVKPATTAPVLVAVSQGIAKAAPARRPKLLSKAGKIALRALKEACAQVGVPNTTKSENIPAGVRTVTKEQWRRYAYQSGISTGETQSANRKAFALGYNAVIGDGLAMVWNEQVWITRKGEIA
jgi:hypothetical protein